MGDITIEFTEPVVKEYLRGAILSWREKKEKASTDAERVMAICYIDAFQSVYASLFGAVFTS